MTKSEWQAITKAGQLLNLGDRATLGEIKRSYHRLCKKYHPDTADEKSCDSKKIYQLTEAYELLTSYCDEYRYPLVPEADAQYEAEDWWMDRFGQDPVWTKGKKQ